MESDDFEPAAVIPTLAQGISRLIEINCPYSKVSTYVRQLQAVCCGPLEDNFSKYYGYLMTPHSCLTSLLKVNGLLKHLQDNTNDGIYISTQLLSVKQLDLNVVEFLQCLIPHLVVSASSSTIQPVLGLLWDHPERDVLPIELIEAMLADTSKIELLLVEIFKQCCKDADAFNCWETSHKIWIAWSSESSFIFQTITSLMNEILINSHSPSAALKMIERYIDRVKATCKDSGKLLQELYPVKFKALVEILLTNLDEERFQSLNSETREIVKDLRSKLPDPRISLMIASHFPSSSFLFT